LRVASSRDAGGFPATARQERDEFELYYDI
jgi:hypothetical protein